MRRDNIFETVAMRKPRLNKFRLDHERKGTLNMGWLYPIYLQECLPGDKFRVKSSVFLRFLALVAPVMHQVSVTVHYFFTPNRILWNQWENFITGGRDGLAAPAVPVFTVQGVNGLSPVYLKAGQLLDHLGFPVMNGTDSYATEYNTPQFSFNCLPLKAYLLIYDTYYRDQNVELSQLTSNFLSGGTIGGADLQSMIFLRPRAWEKDYLTSCLPFTQRGNPVSIPITSTISVSTTGDSGANARWRKGSDGTVIGGANEAGASAAGKTPIQINGANAAAINAYYDPNGTLTASATNLTINAFRVSNMLQVFLENNARGGARYIEQIKAHFGVTVPDARLQRPEYLGGGKQPVVISENLQTAPAAGGSTPLATLSGHGMSVGSTNQFVYKCLEHGWIMGILSVMPNTQYQQFLPKHWYRNVNTDYYFPEFANLGEQAVLNGEAYSNWADGTAVSGWGNTFGYQSRYSEYKYTMSQNVGQFRSNLAYWTLGRSFSSQPNLGTTFVQAGGSVKTDIFAVSTDVDHLVFQCLHKVDALRPMPYHAVPSLMAY